MLTTFASLLFFSYDGINEEHSTTAFRVLCILQSTDRGGAVPPFLVNMASLTLTKPTRVWTKLMADILDFEVVNFLKPFVG